MTLYIEIKINKDTFDNMHFYKHIELKIENNMVHD